MFVVTKELQEFIDSVKVMIKLMKKPSNIVYAILLTLSIISIYFLTIIAADVFGI